MSALGKLREKQTERHLDSSVAGASTLSLRRSAKGGTMAELTPEQLLCVGTLIGVAANMSMSRAVGREIELLKQSIDRLEKKVRRG